MADPVSASSFASSIITFLELAYKVGKRTREFAKLAGDLPPDLRLCRDLVDVIIRASERLKSCISSRGTSSGAIATDLQALLGQCSVTTQELLDLFDEINNCGSLKKALKSVRKEGKLLEIRNHLEQQILAIIFICQENL